MWQGAKAIPQDWLKSAELIQNPQKNYTWSIGGKSYAMEQWVLRFYLSFSAEWDSAGEGNPGLIGGPMSGLFWGKIVRNYFSNLEAWVEFDLTPTWYIEGQGTAYFAIGSIRLAELQKTAHDITGKEDTLDTRMSVSPEGQGAALYIYYGLFGSSSSAETNAASYQGKELNPALFTDKVYAHFDFNNFGVTAWNEMGTIKTKGDVATVGFDMTVFVIGQWDVKDIQEIPQGFGRLEKTLMPPSLLDYLSDPRMQALITLLVMAAIFILLLVFAPGFLVAILALFSGRKRR